MSPEKQNLPLPGTGLYISVGETREFMSRIVEERYVWEKLKEAGDEWGGHLHRVILEVALSDGCDEDQIDLGPILVNEMVNRPNGASILQSIPTRIRSATQLVDEMVRRLDEEQSDDPLESMESMLLYFDQGSLPPGIITWFDEETSSFLRDKYFYPRNGLTGERWITGGQDD